jgi:hypothetical protein
MRKSVEQYFTTAGTENNPSFAYNECVLSASCHSDGEGTVRSMVFD